MLHCRRCWSTVQI